MRERKMSLDKKQFTERMGNNQTAYGIQIHNGNNSHLNSIKPYNLGLQWAKHIDDKRIKHQQQNGVDKEAAN